MNKYNNVIGVPKYSSNGNPGNMNSDPYNRNTWTFNAYIQVNLCNSVIRT